MANTKENAVKLLRLWKRLLPQ